jgi:hypothetical protein
MIVFGLNNPQDGRVHRLFARNTQCWTRFLPGFPKNLSNKKTFLESDMRARALAASPPIKRHRLLWAWQEDFSRRAGFFFFFFKIYVSLRRLCDVIKSLQFRQIDPSNHFHDTISKFD